MLFATQLHIAKRRKIMSQKRKIDITKQNVRICDELTIDGNEIQAVYELWMDVDAYFGTKISTTDGTWINFYTIWNSETEKTTPVVHIDSDDGNEDYPWEFTQTEEEFFRKKMEDYCFLTNGCSLQELWQQEEH